MLLLRTVGFADGAYFLLLFDDSIMDYRIFYEEF